MMVQTTPAIDDLKLDADGLIPAIIQDARSKQVLMMAWMNREAFLKTVETGKTHFYSRSRRKLWLKGESSGHVQTVRSIAKDCDQDVLLIQVDQQGAACHEGFVSCFFRQLDVKSGAWETLGERVFDPAKVYQK
jgi:phosphoribosyl-AMP cyclohydrolase